MFPLIDVDNLFTACPGLDENRIGVQHNLFTIVLTTLKVQDVPVIQSLEECMRTDGSPFLTSSLILNQTEDGKALACMASANYTEIGFQVRTQKCVPSVLWDSRSFGIADPLRVYKDLPYRVMELALQFAEDYTAAQVMPDDPEDPEDLD